MECYTCQRAGKVKAASTKIGKATGSMFAAFMPGFIKDMLHLETWTKSERYYCCDCYLTITLGITGSQVVKLNSALTEVPKVMVNESCGSGCGCH